MTDRRVWLTRRRALTVMGATAFAGCSTVGGNDRQAALGQQYDLAVSHGGAELASDWGAPTDAPPVADLATDVLIENLEVPWDLSFAADGTLFITERVGRVVAFDGEDVRVVAEPSDAIDAESVDPGADHEGWWVEGGEGGTLGVAVHPTYPDPPLVYVYYTAETTDGRRNRVVAFDPTAEDPSDVAGVVVEDIPADGVHNGGRLAFGPEQYLWVTCGDAGRPERASNPTTLHGTVLKLTPAGNPAPDNPDRSEDADPRIYTYGHRNPQGISWLPDGTPVVAEHGPGGRDELNRLEPGADYGWPDVRHRAAYPGADGHKPLANSGEPPAWAPTGSLFYTGETISGLRNRLLVGGLFSQQLLVATVTPPNGTLPPVGDGTRHDGAWSDDAYTVTTHTALEDDLGRIRHVEQGPDGGVYLITSNRDGRAREPFPTDRDDVLVRLTTS